MAAANNRAFAVALTIAEGILDEGALALLRAMGVDYFQSFITGTPQSLIPAPGVDALL